MLPETLPAASSSSAPSTTAAPTSSGAVPEFAEVDGEGTALFFAPPDDSAVAGGKLVHPQELEPHDLATVMDDHGRLDRLEDHILAGIAGQTAEQWIPVHMPVVHTFTPGLYSRRIFMPGPHGEQSGTLLTSRLHLTTHQYAVLAGVAWVLIPGEPSVRLAAGHTGVTHAGTRRGLYIEEDCSWVTYHPLTAEEEALRAGGASEAELVAAVESRIIGTSREERNVFAEYQDALASRGLPGPHDGPRALKEDTDVSP